MSAEATTPLAVVNVPNVVSWLAGFEVTLYGRFWVTPEGRRLSGTVTELETQESW